MKDTEILNTLKTKFPDVELEWVQAEAGDSYLFVPAAKLVDVITCLKDSEELFFDYLMNVSAFDATDHIQLTWHLYSYKHRHTFIIKVKVPRENASIATISHLYGTANFQEREVFDHFGVKFTGHPNLKRILLPDDWKGYPLLKDYKEEESYNGIETTRPSLL